MSEENLEIVLIPSVCTPTQLETSIRAFNQPLADLLEHIGLPTENILSPINERRKVIYALESTLEIIPLEDRIKATYLSKFTVSIAVGLFDGALNFLWDETIKALGRLIIGFDIQYLKYVITATPNLSVIQIKQLLDNIRRNIIPDEDFPVIGNDISNQPQERIDDFLLSIFGLYCDPRQEQQVKVNIEKLIPYVWNCALEDAKYQIGSKFGLYRKNGDIPRINATQKVLELVSGLTYKDEDSLAAELT